MGSMYGLPETGHRRSIAVATTGSASTGNAAVGRDQHGAGFVAPTDQLEEQVRRVGLQRQR
jgi:hypothetical protein